MREDNFIAFWTVFGFFTGIAVALWRCGSAFDMLSVAAVTTLFFYLIAHLSVALFVRFMEFGKIHFEKEAYDRKLDYFYNQLLQRESEIDINRTYFVDEGPNTKSGREKG